MKPLIHRVLRAYRPLYQRGLLMDGLYHWPAADAADDPSAPGRSHRPRMLLVALTSPGSLFSFRRNRP